MFGLPYPTYQNRVPSKNSRVTRYTPYKAKKPMWACDWVCNALLNKKRLAYTTRVGYESGTRASTPHVWRKREASTEYDTQPTDRV